MNMKQSLQYLATWLLGGAVSLLAVSLGLGATRGIDFSNPGLVMVLGTVGLILAALTGLVFLASRKTRG